MSAPNLPVYLTPAQSGMLSNTRGSNTGADAIALKARYFNPLSGTADQVGCINVQANRTARASGVLQTSQPLWPSGWTGTPAVEGIPTAASEAAPVAGTAPGTGTTPGRVYILFLGTTVVGGSGNCWSAPLIAGGVGAWRPEAGLGPCGTWFGFSSSSTVNYVAGATQMVYAQGFMYALVGTTVTTQNAAMLMAPVGADGVLGPWQKAADAPYSLASGAQLCGGPSIGTAFSAVLVIMGGKNTSGNVVGTVNATAVNADGSLVGYSTQAALGGNRQNGTAYWDGNYPGAYLIAGDDGTNVASSVLFGDFRTGAITTWTTPNSLPAARTGAALAVTLGPDNLTHFWVLGGSLTIGGAATTTVYHSNLTGPGTLAAWTTFGTALSVTGAGIVGWSGSTPGSYFHTGQRGDAGTASGAALANATACYMFTASTACYMGTVHAAAPAWRTGDAPGLTVANLGTTGASITANSDGSQDIAWDYGAFGGAVTAGSDGDTIQLAVQFVSIKGFASPIAYTSFKVGQPPTIGSISPANAGTVTNGQPPLSFAYTPGAGGAGEYSYRIQLKQASTQIIDSALRYDGLNALSPLLLAPLLVPSTTYTLIIDVAANPDTPPMPGSSNTATSSTTFSTSAYVPLAAPGGFTATPNGATGSIALAWNTVATATFYRVYYRRTGTTTWSMLADPGTTALTFTAMDNIALGISYDFAVSAGANSIESVLSTVQAATIPLGTYSAYLHIVGNGITYGLPLQVQGSPGVTERIAASDLLGFGQTAPVARYGQADYRLLAVSGKLLDSTPATLQSLQALMDQVKAGATCFYRDALGGVRTVAFVGDQAITVLPPYYREVALKMTEVPNLSRPYVAAGTAQGYASLTGGTIPPLATAERML